MDLSRLTPSVDELTKLAPAEQFSRVQNHMVASFNEHECRTDSARRREWFGAWRHFYDELEARQIVPAAMVAIVQNLLTATEKFFEAQP